MNGPIILYQLVHPSPLIGGLGVVTEGGGGAETALLCSGGGVLEKKAFAARCDF